MARRRERTSRGATVVEAAIVTPLLFLLIFGVLEFSLYFKDRLAASNATRAGARIGSAQGTAAAADWEVIQAVMKNQRAWGRVTKIVVFKATGPSATIPASCTTGPVGVSGACNVYSGSDFTMTNGQFLDVTYTKDNYWPASSRVTSLSAATGPQYIGVWVSGTHRSASRLVLSDRTITDQAVMRLEPTS